MTYQDVYLHALDTGDWGEFVAQLDAVTEQTLYH